MCGYVMSSRALCICTHAHKHTSAQTQLCTAPDWMSIDGWTWTHVGACSMYGAYAVLRTHARLLGHDHCLAQHVNGMRREKWNRFGAIEHRWRSKPLGHRLQKQSGRKKTDSRLECSMHATRKLVRTLYSTDLWLLWLIFFFIILEPLNLEAETCPSKQNEKRIFYFVAKHRKYVIVAKMPNVSSANLMGKIYETHYITHAIK